MGMSNEVKILDVTIDRKFTFNTHVANVCKIAVDTYKKLSRVAKISWGLHPEIVRTIYIAAIVPIISQSASVWAHAAKKIGIQKSLNAVQRGLAQKICSAYGTVSLNSCYYIR